ncbi:hypothetical protein HK104_008675 [Borealophlyctis nickersoniae]|nr:hypothetical protein HK104_008675 [Borealophlyctis nickersoniae]
MALLLQLERQILAPLVGDHCAQRLAAFDISSKECISLFISKGLGLGVVAGSSVLKIPQLQKIVAAQSATGLSLTSYLLETAAYCISTAYNWRGGNPLSTYGEFFFLTIQDILISLLIMYYARSYTSLWLVLGVLLGSIYALASPDIISTSTLALLQFSTIFIGISSKLPQIYNNFAAKSTGVLSAFTVFLQFAGSAARVFTTLKEVDDQVLVVSNTVACALNGILVLQMIMYWNAKPMTKRKKRA